MALVQHLRNPEYFRFFRERLDEGDEVILDNGAYEGSQLEPTELRACAGKLNPTCLVLPDAPWQFRETIRRTEDFLLHYNWPAEKSMTVLHAPNGKFEQFAATYTSCKTKWVGLSRLTRDYAQQMDRSSFIKELKFFELFNKDLRHHALGMLDGNLADLAECCAENFYSMDSSAPIWRGLYGYSLTSDKPWPNIPFDPDWQHNRTETDQVDHNIDLIERICGNYKSRQSA